MGKKLSAYDPVLQEQGIDFVAAASKAGVGIQALQVAMVGGGIFVFAENGLADMADGNYSVFVQNTTDVADPGAVALADRLPTQITVTGPDVADELDILIVGRLAGQQA
ncbi:MAG: hypothetical protein JSW58_07405 [Candidatus Latescibacterota bacterium]|nr:MAG: hypothetical protein JSW58_07405 [Candidatus Latescibacterota bacterium]